MVTDLRKPQKPQRGHYDFLQVPSARGKSRIGKADKVWLDNDRHKPDCIAYSKRGLANPSECIGLSNNYLNGLLKQYKRDELH